MEQKIATLIRNSVNNADSDEKKGEYKWKDQRPYLNSIIGREKHDIFDADRGLVSQW